MKNKSRAEQLFIMIAGSIMCYAILCITGCGGKSCECVKFGCENGDNYSGIGISIPGLAGCFSSGKGCNSCLCAQSRKCFYFKGEAYDVVDKTEKTLTITACDTRYYGAGCLGCGQVEKSCAIGCADGDGCSKGVFYENDGKGCYMGGAGGSFSCTDTDGTVEEDTRYFEEGLDIY
ncbi:MAG: hypothetical protein IJ806_00900 [Ruminococcus sp.]|nr:hypothetical protein [Ruminococcus sp.]